MDLVPVLSTENNSKKYDGRIWWEGWTNIVEVNGEKGGSKSSDLKNGDKVLVKFGTKSKKMFKGIVEFHWHSVMKMKRSLKTNKRWKFLQMFKKEPARKEKQDEKI